MDDTPGTSATDRGEAPVRIDEAALRAMVDQVPAMIGYWGRDMRNRFANAAYTRWLDKPLDQVVGRSVAELLGDDFVQRYGAYLAGVLAGERQVYNRAVPRADGGMAYHRVSYIPDLHEGEVRGFFVLTTDISELVASQQALERALQQKETLLHEQLSRADNLASVSLQRYVDDLASEIAQAHEGVQDRVALHIDVPAMDIGLDAAMPLGLLLTELITNCYKHAFPDARAGRIDLGIAPQGQGMSITVRDDGVGLPPGFDPERLPSMGIRLAAGLAQQLGGTLRYTSGPGTTARVEDAHLASPRA